MSEWKEIILDDVTIKITDGAHHSPKEHKGGMPMFSIKDMREQGFYYDNAKTISTDDYQKLINSGCQPEMDDILIAKDGSVLKHVFRVKDKPDYVLLSSIAIVRPDKSLIDPTFLVYTIKEPATKDLILSNFVGGSGVPRIVLKDFKQVDLSIPSLSKQKAIAEVLSSLDDKIDLLHRQNKTLEQMAETLFREWFIEEAKEDWEEGVLGDLVNVKYGKDHKRLKDGLIPVFGSGGIMRYADTILYNKESVLIPRKGTLNNVIYINEPFWTVDTMFYTEMKRSNLAKFVYHYVNGQDLSNMNVGSAVPSMTTQVLNNMPVNIPPDETLNDFENMVSPMYSKQRFNTKHIRTFEKMRDTLLPRLMSGEVKISINE